MPRLDDNTCTTTYTMLYNRSMAEIADSLSCSYFTLFCATSYAPTLTMPFKYF